MPGARGRGRGRRGRSRLNRLESRLASLHFAERGGAVRGRFDPPQIASSPWNNLVVAFNQAFPTGVSGLQSTTYVNIQTALLQQIGLVTTQNVDMRLMRLDVWNIASNPQYIPSFSNASTLAISTLDFVTGNRYGWLEDAGTPTHYPHIHFIWPRHLQEYVFTNRSQGVIYVTDVAGATVHRVHLHVLWRPTQPDPLPTFRLPHYSGETFELVSLSEL